MGKNEKTLGLSALVFCLGTSAAANAESIKVQALRLLSENRITVDEYQAMVKESTGGIGSYVTAGDYGSYVTAGDYASYITDANYADYITAGNYADYITESNYAAMPVNPGEVIPSPEIVKNK